MNIDLRKQVIDLFIETGHAHHKAFAETDGADPDWPIWYAGYLQNPLSEVMRTKFTRSQLVYCLMDADFERAASDPCSDWQDFYAGQFIERHAPSETVSRDKLSLYHFPGCPFCAMVSSTIKRLGLEVERRNILESPDYFKQLIAARGRTTVPVLRIDSPDGGERWIPESQDIMRYLKTISS
jgi:glutaredoxin